MKKTRIILSLSLLVSVCAYSPCGYTMTTTATSQSITIPMSSWTLLKSELETLNSDLIQCQKELTLLKKPSSQLVTELTQAQDMLKKLNQELEASKNDLTTLSNEVGELKTLLATLRTQIDKERRVHRRQLWQNRIWCIVGGVAIGYAVRK